jgi:NAD(P)H-hydrate repair Nnr-like enzyme with NAD(P)H-hydrate epimerase domain
VLKSFANVKVVLPTPLPLVANEPVVANPTKSDVVIDPLIGLSVQNKVEES